MDEAFPYRQKDYACIHPETYKYFFQKDDVIMIWGLLREKYGEIQENKPFFCMQLDSRFFIFKSTLGGNPITVIRKHGCRPEHVDELHALFGFKEER